MQHLVNHSVGTARVAYRTLTPSLAGKAIDAISLSFGDHRSRDPFTLALKLTEKDWRGLFLFNFIILLFHFLLFLSSLSFFWTLFLLLYLAINIL